MPRVWSRPPQPAASGNRDDGGEGPRQRLRLPPLGPATMSKRTPPPKPPAPITSAKNTHCRPGKPPVAAIARRATSGSETVDGQGCRRPSRPTYDFWLAQQPDELGRLGPYRVLQVLGHGGMGVVFQAEDPQLERTGGPQGDAAAPGRPAPSAQQRFLREAQAAAAIKHDHIVTIYQVGEDRGVPFLAMEFLEGRAAGRAAQARAASCRWPRCCASAARSPRGWRRPTSRA